jgi:hypothetical protein
MTARPYRTCRRRGSGTATARLFRTRRWLDSDRRTIEESTECRPENARLTWKVRRAAEAVLLPSIPSGSPLLYRRPSEEAVDERRT